MSSNNNNDPQQAPAGGAFASAYENFIQETPLITRYVLQGLFVSWFVSFFFDSTLAISNIPYLTIFQFELYRMIVSPIVCPNILSLIFAYLSFMDSGKRLEYSMGSTQFAWLLISIGTLTNLGVIVFAFGMYFMASGGNKKDPSWLFISSSGIWILLFGMIAMECGKAPRNSQRKFFMWTLPTLYYPIILAFVFSLFGGVSIPHYISLAIGYGYSYGYMDKLKLSSSKCKEWEDTILLNFTRRHGWVVGHSATGMDAWNDMISSSSSGTGSGLSNIFRSWNNTESNNPSFPSGGGQTLGSTTAATNNSNSFPSSGGQTLGNASTTTTRRTPSDVATARIARLQALDP